MQQLGVQFAVMCGGVWQCAMHFPLLEELHQLSFDLGHKLRCLRIKLRISRPLVSHLAL